MAILYTFTPIWKLLDIWEGSKTSKWHCVKISCIRSLPGPYFSDFGLNTGIYSVSLHIQSECGKIRTRQTLNTNTFHVVWCVVEEHHRRASPKNQARQGVHFQLHYTTTFQVLLFYLTIFLSLLHFPSQWYQIIRFVFWN